MSDGLGQPQEFNEEVIDRAASASGGEKPFSVVNRRPARQVTIPAPGGRSRVVEVPDKDAMWSVESKLLRANAYNVGVSPSNGVVTITDIKGQHLARYENRASAVLKLEKDGVDIDSLAGHERLKPQAEDDSEPDLGSDPENPIVPKRRAGRPKKLIA